MPAFLILSFVGLWRQWRSGTSKPVLLLVGLTALFLACWPPAEWLFSLPIEIWYADAVPPLPEAAEAIVILASHVQPVSKYWPVPLPDTSTIARCRYGALLFRRHAVPVIVSGGISDGQSAPVAEDMAALLASDGVPPAHIHREEQSRNTYENAKYSSDLLRRLGIARIALVVEADSMLRAEWCFRRQGIKVVPAPFAHRELGFAPHDLLPSWAALRGNERTLHEMGGVVFYKLRGWI